MPSPGLQWQPLQIPLAAGLDTRADVRAGNPPGLAICRDVQFDDEGGLQTRHPFVSIGSSAILGGGTLANLRVGTENGDELVVFSSDTMYSWSPQQLKWVPRGTHLAVAVDESSRFASPGDQVLVDRAELGGVIVYTWTENVPGGVSSSSYAAAYDKATGAVLVAPTVVSTSSNVATRLVALATRVLMFTDSNGSGGIAVRSIDPASPATGINSAGVAVLTTGGGPGNFDVVKVDSQDLAIGVCRLNPATSYSLFTVTPALAVSIVTKARTCDGPIGVSTFLGAGTAGIVARVNGTNIQADHIITSTLADGTIVGAAIGTATSVTVNQLAIAFRDSNTSFIFWTSGSLGETATSTDFTVKVNTFAMNSAIGTQAVLRHQLGIASRAFAYQGRVYVWLAFAGQSGTSTTGNASGVRAQLQNTYFLYRDDGLLVARAADDNAGGFTVGKGGLPGVQLISGSTGFAWCGTTRRVVELGGIADHTGFAARTPRDILFTFDDNRARRTARIGKTLYISGSIPLQYDGLSLAEVGFLIYPWFFEPTIRSVGSILAGTYTWKATNRWTNAQGEVDRSSTATGMTLLLPGSETINLAFMNLYVTLKTSPRTPALDIWRNEVNAATDSPFYLVTDQDPSVGLITNGYIVNDDTAVAAGPLVDDRADSFLTTREQSLENGDVLEYLAPPGAQLIVATDVRVFLGAVAGFPDQVWYSRQRGTTEIASFHDSLTIDIPPPGGLMTAIAFNNETLTVFRLSAIYALPGEGFSNTLVGQNYGPPRIISLDVGAISQEAVALTPVGLLFKSRKGWFLLGADWALKYVGAEVQAFDTDVVTSIDVVETQHQVRILSSARMLVWDYLVGQWSEWTVTDGISTTMWQGRQAYLSSTGVKVQSDTFTGTTYGVDVETAWIKAADLQGSQMVRQIALLGEVRGSHLVRLRVARDYQYVTPGNPDYMDDEIWTQSPATLGNALQVQHAPSMGDVDAIKVRITAVTAGSSATLTTLAFDPVTVPTLSTPWAAILTAAAAFPGDYGNRLAMSVAMEYAAGQFLIDVRDHFFWSSALSRWRESVNCVGVRIVANELAPPTIGQLQAAITAATKLATITTPDNPAKVLSPLSGSWSQTTGTQFSGGAYGVPTGESLKLTGLGLEVGVKSGLYRRLPATQKV